MINSMPLLKKRKFKDAANETYSDSLLSDAEAEVAVEIALRQRLLETLESRIAWATVLKEVLHKGNGDATSETFRNVALDALQIADAPSEMILCHDPLPPLPSRTTKPTRPPPRNVLSLNHKSKPSFLFIRSSTLPSSKGDRQDNYFYILKCPACFKTSFTSLQGLLNHARLVHNLEWGTHEECISACAVPDNELDVTAGTEVGLGPTGILPGLRNIFQMAVGTHNASSDRVCSPSTTKSAVLTTTNSLNQTLGLHDESPALAPFLGKEPIRRQIKVFDEDAEVDIERGTALQPASKRRRMPFAHRHLNFLCSSLERQDSEEMSDVDSLKNEKSANFPSMRTENPLSTHSRFHLVSRIIITDRSLWISPEERISEYQKYTHKWMISIDSPSYTHHITSILNSVKVTPADTNIHIPFSPAKTTPPFAVIGLSDKPFLAKITLRFSGRHGQDASSSTEQILIFDHWVDLYPSKEPHVVKGQEQVVDIELDKETIIKPPQRDYTPIESKSLWSQPFEVVSACDIVPETEHRNPPERYEEKLAEIVQRFPMTVEDIKGRRSKLPNLPYMLASSVQHLLTFVMGRRKAIEWSRARAIHDDYTQSLTESSTLESSVPLSVADVYSWLSENDHFLRPDHDSIQSRSARSSFNQASTVQIARQGVEMNWCRFCGLDTSFHDKVASFKKEGREGSVSELRETFADAKRPLVMRSVSGCPIADPELQINKLPRIDIKRFVLPDQLSLGRVATLDSKLLVEAVDPSMVLRIYALIEQWNLPTFDHSLDRLSVMPLDKFGQCRKEIETYLAPYALLSLIAQRFIEALVSRGMKVANRDKSIALSSISSRKRSSRNQVSGAARILTPTHILSGILTRGGLGRETTRHQMDMALLLLLSQLGISVDEFQDLRQGSREGRLSPLKIKMED